MNYREQQDCMWVVNKKCAHRNSWLIQAARNHRLGRDMTYSLANAMWHDKIARDYGARRGVRVPAIPDRFIPMLTEHRLLTR